MSIHKSVRIECDVCCCFGDEAPTAAIARSKLRRDGWKTERGVDLCPMCKAQVKANGWDVVVDAAIRD